MISVISRICFAILYCNKIENDMKLKDLRNQCAEEDKTFTIYVKPKKFSYKELRDV